MVVELFFLSARKFATRDHYHIGTLLPYMEASIM